MQDFRHIQSIAQYILQELAEIDRKCIIGKTPLAENACADPNAQDKLQALLNQTRAEYRQILQEPFTAYVKAINVSDDDQELTYLIRRGYTPFAKSDSGAIYVNYFAPMGRIAEVNVNELAAINLPRGTIELEIIEKNIFKPRRIPSTCKWDGLNNLISLKDGETYSILSLLELLQEYARAPEKKASFDIDELNALERKLQEQLEKRKAIRVGIQKEIVGKIELRDQPVLDSFQGEIFRLPLDSQLILTGAPGTGKTTTLIKRLAQKSDLTYIDNEEKDNYRLTEEDERTFFTRENWYLFTPNDLLKIYLKEALAKDGLPGTNKTVKVWNDLRKPLGRDFGILRIDDEGFFTPVSGKKFICVKSNSELINYFELFYKYCNEKLIANIQKGYEILCLYSSDIDLIDKFKKIVDSFSGQRISEVAAIDAVIKLQEHRPEYTKIGQSVKDSTENIVNALLRAHNDLLEEVRKVTYRDIIDKDEAHEKPLELDDFQANPQPYNYWRFFDIEFKGKDKIKQLSDALREAKILNVNGTCDTVEDLNYLLKRPELYVHIAASDKVRLDLEDRNNLKQLREIYEKTKMEDDLIKLNRIAIEKFYPDESPKSSNWPIVVKEQISRVITWHAERVARMQAISSKSTKNDEVLSIIKQYLPPEKIMQNLGARIIVRQATNRLTSGFSNLLERISSAYQQFRVEQLSREAIPQLLDKRYAAEIKAKKISDNEIDILIYIILKNARMIFGNNRRLLKEETKNNILEKLKNHHYRTQIAVDEATDFTSIQLGCMYHLSHPVFSSVTFSGDLMQRVTELGLSQWEECSVVGKFDIRTINTVYRQNPNLLAIAQHLYREIIGVTPPFTSAYDADQVYPAPLKFRCENDIDMADWISDRILEIYKINNRQLPSIAIFVSDENRIKETYDVLSEILESHSIDLEQCHGGKILGEGSKVRIFSVDFIKGLEFEGVFFVDIDTLSLKAPDLIDKYLYVGLTRAASFLAITLKDDFPKKIDFIENYFKEGDWKYLIG